jgi:alkylresorcinol/alkylpyrone synthase
MQAQAIAISTQPRAAHPQHPCIVGTGTALPPYRYGQEELAQMARSLLPGLDIDDQILTRFFRRVGVKQRYLALPKERYAELDGLGSRNDAWLFAAVPLAQRAVQSALAAAGLGAGDVDMVMSTTITGIAVPSLEARLMNRLHFRSDAKRVPLFGLGCLAGAAGLARSAEYLRAYPQGVALFVSVELCSLTLQRDDTSSANLISTGLFGDGAAAVVMVGAEHPLARAGKARVLDSMSMFFPDTERVMGWDVVDGGFKIVLGREVPFLAKHAVPELVDRMLGRSALTRGDVARWVAHPGGPAVMDAMRDGLGLGEDALADSRRSLAEVGNMSSASVLFLLHDALERRAAGRALDAAQEDSYAVMLAMGPAFCAEAVLLQC